jgi:hypothetical protein
MRRPTSPSPCSACASCGLCSIPSRSARQLSVWQTTRRTRRRAMCPVAELTARRTAESTAEQSRRLRPSTTICCIAGALERGAVATNSAIGSGREVVSGAGHVDALVRHRESLEARSRHQSCNVRIANLPPRMRLALRGKRRASDPSRWRQPLLLPSRERMAQQGCGVRCCASIGRQPTVEAEPARGGDGLPSSLSSVKVTASRPLRQRSTSVRVARTIRLPLPLVRILSRRCCDVRPR